MHIGPSLGAIHVSRLKPAPLAELYGKLALAKIPIREEGTWPGRQRARKGALCRPLGPNTVPADPSSHSSNARMASAWVLLLETSRGLWSPRRLPHLQQER